MNVLSWRWGAASMLMLALLGVLATPTTTWAEEQVVVSAADEAADLGVGYALDNGVLFLAAVMVFFMQAGFAMLTAGFNASKNTVNVLFKNAMDVCVGVLLYFAIGFGIMYAGGYEGASPSPYFGFGGFGIEGYSNDTFSPAVDWLFQAVFAATAATIVAGAVAGRMRVGAYLIYSAVLTGFVYPVSGFWKWGEGFLDAMGFQDFAGSAVVHGVGGFAGLAGAIVLGPRIGRFVEGKSIAMPGHSLPLACLGMFILWFGWYGFNSGSQLAFHGTDDINAMTHIAMTTTLAAGAGGIIATLASWGLFGKPDLSMGLNGVLGGLVSITANCDAVTPWIAILIGAVGGLLVIAGVMLLDKLRIDDPVGAWPVHGLCGIWGCLALGILPNAHFADGTTNLVTQLTGTAIICGWAFVTMLGLFSILKAAGLLRVSAEDEKRGLDISEHGMQAYSVSM